ncbi:MAG: hypothetical protein P0Y55_15290 [Candidatus Cohnella colombiensis]|uniref:Glycosyltransferase n=1 Tax=Candidatus Cohnella colombiensis TaxID=3121368 RepID=A0AA95EUX6_9BACL|nr:MAG: hypothetical protein P0Y55_15290 [Cohnella sp.]
MFLDLMWIIGLYAAAVAIVHWAYRREAGVAARHYVLVAGNHQMEIEGYVRALQHFSRRSGTDIAITVVLDHSSDETGAIMDRFAKRGTGIACIRKEEQSGLHKVAADGEQHQVIWIELDQVTDLAKLP